MRVELLTTEDCPHSERTEENIRAALSDNGHTPNIERVYIGDIEDAADLGFHGSPTLRIDGMDVVRPPASLPINTGCRLYTQPDGTLDGVIPVEVIAAELERRREAEARDKAAAFHPGQVPAKTSKALFLWASRRRALGSVATAIPLTRRMVHRFVAGDSLDDALTALEALKDQGMRWTVDVLGESVDSREAATASADRYIATLDALAARNLEANVSLKLTQMGLEIDPIFCLENVRRVVSRAREIGAFVRVDMEDHSKTDQTLEIARTLHDDYSEVGVVIQSYLRRSADDIDRLIATQTRVRLCKGAYDEPGSVAFTTKQEVDESYRQLMERLLLDGKYPALATHDEAIIEQAITFAREHDIGPDRFEFQMLYGVRRDLHERLIALGWTVRVYVPYGTEWYPYYMRRLAERPQNVFFILFSVMNEGRGKKAA
ncbi:MAG TPA: proline dehydrogenase family protein [Candidatus Limnocylindrales bacterium]